MFLGMSKVWCVWAGAAGLAWGASGDVVLLGAAHDNTMYQDGDNLSNGAGGSFFVGKTTIETVRRGLISFDFSAIPAGSTVQSVSLTLHCTRSSSLAHPITVHMALASWGEGDSVALGEGGTGTAASVGDATWRYRFYPSVEWGAPGGDLGAAVATKQVAGEGVYTWSSAGMVGAVQGWVDMPATNLGWVLVGNEEDIQTAKRFGSRENEDPSVRPVLVVEYTPVPGPGAVPVVCGAVVLAVRRRRG